MVKKADIFICGDIINQTTGKQFIDKNLLKVMRNCDYCICNFEGTCKTSTLQKGQMLQHDSTLKSLKEAGFNLLLLANNHVTDYGEQGLRGTIESIDKHSFDRMGAGFGYEETYRPHIFEINGLKIGIINLCEAQLGQFKSRDFSFGYAWIGDFGVDDRIRKLRNVVDYLILIPHAGLECYPIPLNQFRLLYRHWCDLGVDVIVGGHPHIAQGIEEYGCSTIFYSLGNFFFTGFNGESDTWTKGISCVLHFTDSCMTYEVIQHKMNDECVKRVYSDINDIKTKNLIIANEDSYRLALKQQNAEAFRNLLLRLYMSALNGTSQNDSFFTKLKKIVYYLTNRKILYSGSEKYRMQVLKRLVENETYRYLTISAIEDQVTEN